MLRPLLLTLVGCATQTTTAVVPVPEAPAPPSRQAFNQAAVELNLPVFQTADGQQVTVRNRLGGPTADAAARIADHVAHPPTMDARQHALTAELAQGRPTLIQTTDIRPEDAAMVRALLEVGDIIETLHARQLGTAGLADTLPPTDTLGRALIARTQGPWCEAPTTVDNPDCHATLKPTPRISGLYPPSVQQGEDWCSTVPRAAMDPFHVLAEQDGALVAVPYSEHWATDMGRAAATLRKAADAAPPDEPVLQAYLRAAADAFESNDWFAADAAWAAMSQDNSRWYLRVGPDETYFDPCSEHAGFHMVLAKVNPSGLALQQRLSPLKQDLEHTVAQLAGPPYAERTVGFDLPEFINIVLNAGDARKGIGATIGQSLPNWGPVADAGGRTVAMTNIGTDPDSVASLERALGSVMCSATHTAWPRDPEPLLFSTILHEAAHNLGPSGDYTVDGKKDTEVFGGPLANMLEELKAETAAMSLRLWLADHGHYDPDEQFRSQVADIGWALGNIAGGLVDGAGNPLPYGQLAAVHVGHWLSTGAMSWHPEILAANGQDMGCFEAHRDALPGAIQDLAQQVFQIKAQGNKAAAEALRDRHVSEGTDYAELRAIIAKRFSREPKNSYLYRVELPEG